MFFSALLVICTIGQIFGDFRVPLLTAPLGRLPLPRLATFKAGNEEYFDKVTTYEVWQAPHAGREISTLEVIGRTSVNTMLLDAKDLLNRGQLTLEKLEVKKLYNCSSCYYVKDADILAAVPSLTQANLDDVNGYKIQELHDFAVAAMETKFCFNMTLVEQKLNISSLSVINDEWPLFVAEIVAAAVKCRAHMLGVTQSELSQHLNTTLSTLLGYNINQIETTLLLITKCTAIGPFTCTTCSGSIASRVVCNVKNPELYESDEGDDDECQENLDNCSVNATCTDTNGRFICACDDGFSGNGVICTDDDECALGSDYCHNALATCSNTIGSFTCACNSGYKGDGRNCTDKDECALGSDYCHNALATCSNTIGSFTCTCNGGYTGDGRNCIDIDECTLGTDNCHSTLATCSNTFGSFTCGCNSGYIGDGRNCIVSTIAPTEATNTVGIDSSSPLLLSRITIGVLIGIFMAAIVIITLVVLVVAYFFYRRMQRTREERCMSTTSATTSAITSSTATNTQGTSGNASLGTPTKGTSITTIPNTVFDEDVSPARAIPQPYEDYLEAAMYATLDSSKRDPVDENYQRLDLGYTQVNKDLKETIPQYISIITESFVEENEADHSGYEVMPN